MPPPSEHTDDGHVEDVGAEGREAPVAHDQGLHHYYHGHHQRGRPGSQESYRQKCAQEVSAGTAQRWGS